MQKTKNADIGRQHDVLERALKFSLQSACVCDLHHFSSLSISCFLRELQIVIALSSRGAVGTGGHQASQRKGAWHAEGRRSALSRSSTGCHGAQNGSSGPALWQEPCTVASEPPIRCTTTRSVAPPPTPAPGLSASSLRGSRRSVWPRR